MGAVFCRATWPRDAGCDPVVNLRRATGRASACLHGRAAGGDCGSRAKAVAPPLTRIRSGLAPGSDRLGHLIGSAGGVVAQASQHDNARGSILRYGSDAGD